MKTKYQTVILLACLLIGCKDKQNYSYYLHHPSLLKQVIEECSSQYDKTREQAARCDIAISAANQLMELIREQQAHPEEFGQQVLDAQIKYVKLKEQTENTQAVVENLKQNKASSAELRKAQDNWYKAKKACREQAQQIKTLLAVLGLSSPE